MTLSWLKSWNNFFIPKFQNSSANMQDFNIGGKKCCFIAETKKKISLYKIRFLYNRLAQNLHPDRTYQL